MTLGILETLQELIYPRLCLICRKRLVLAESYDYREPVCSVCLETITLNTPPFCQKCGRKLSGKYTVRNICKECVRTNFYFDRAWASCRYQGTLRELTHCFKYQGKTALKNIFSKLLINFIRDYHLPISYCDYLIPIPLSSAKLREREFNQAQVLSLPLADYFGIKLMNDNLSRIRNTASQTELDKSLRLRNIQGAFSLKEPKMITGKSILLIDDVLTTGSTCSEAARILKEAEAGAVFVLTLAN